jgi:hypothetical protein
MSTTLVAVMGALLVCINDYATNWPERFFHHYRGRTSSTPVQVSRWVVRMMTRLRRSPRSPQITKEPRTCSPLLWLGTGGHHHCYHPVLVPVRTHHEGLWIQPERSQLFYTERNNVSHCALSFDLSCRTSKLLALRLWKSSLPVQLSSSMRRKS